MDGGVNMKYLVVSDNHGNRDVLVDLVHVWEKKIDGMFHCGDSELKEDDTLWQKFVVVKGNCDYSPEYKKETAIAHGQQKKKMRLYVFMVTLTNWQLRW
jgi:predicted phosphodiesterase